MVQLHDFEEYHYEPCPYWKIDSGQNKDTKELRSYLQSKQFECRRRRGLPRLRELYVNCQRGFVSYEGIKTAELKRFITNRVVPTSTDRKNTRYTLIRQLERADDEATFDRLLDLPPEIRCQIYEHYFHSLYALHFGCGRRPMGSQPPITRISKQTRNEALPLYYSRCCFTFSAYNRKKEQFCWSSTRFMRNTLDQHFARIQFLEVTFDHMWELGNWSNITVYVSINNHYCSVRLTGFGADEIALFGDRSFTIDGPIAVVQKLQELLIKDQHPFVRSIAARPSQEKFQNDDFHVLVRGIAHSIQQAAAHAS